MKNKNIHQQIGRDSLDKAFLEARVVFAQTAPLEAPRPRGEIASERMDNGQIFRNFDEYLNYLKKEKPQEYQELLRNRYTGRNQEDQQEDQRLLREKLLYSLSEATEEFQEIDRNFNQNATFQDIDITAVEIATMNNELEFPDQLSVTSFLRDFADEFTIQFLEFQLEKLHTLIDLLPEDEKPAYLSIEKSLKLVIKSLKEYYKESQKWKEASEKMSKLIALTTGQVNLIGLKAINLDRLKEELAVIATKKSFFDQQRKFIKAQGFNLSDSFFSTLSVFIKKLGPFSIDINSSDSLLTQFAIIITTKDNNLSLSSSAQFAELKKFLEDIESLKASDPNKYKIIALSFKNIIELLNSGYTTNAYTEKKQVLEKAQSEHDTLLEWQQGLAHNRLGYEYYSKQSPRGKAKPYNFATTDVNAIFEKAAQRLGVGVGELTNEMIAGQYFIEMKECLGKLGGSASVLETAKEKIKHNEDLLRLAEKEKEDAESRLAEMKAEMFKKYDKAKNNEERKAVLLDYWQKIMHYKISLFDAIGRIKQYKQNISYHKAIISYQQLNPQSSDQFTTIATELLGNVVVPEGSYWNIFSGVTEKFNLQQNFSHLNDYLWGKPKEVGAERIPEPEDARVKQYLLFAGMFGYIDHAALRGGLRLNHLEIYNAVAEALGTGKSDKLKNLIEGADLSKAFKAYQKYEQFYFHQEEQDRRRDLQLEVFERSTTVDLRKTREKFVKLYRAQDVALPTADGANREKKYKDPRLWFKPDGTIDLNLVNSELLVSFLQMHNNKEMSDRVGSTKTDQEAANIIMGNPELLKILQSEILYHLDHQLTIESDFFNASSMDSKVDFMKKGVDTWMDMVTSGDPLKMTTAVGIFYGVFKLVFGTGRTSQFAKWGLGAVFLREFVKEYNGVDIFKELGIVSEENEQELTTFQIYLDKLRGKEAELQTSTHYWEKEALSSKFSPGLMKAMHDIPMMDLLEWHTNLKSQFTAENERVGKVQDIVFDNVPPRLMEYIEDTPGGNTDAGKKEKTMIAAALLDLFFKDVATERSQYASPSIDDGKRVVEDQLDDKKFFEEQDKTTITFGQMLRFSISAEDFKDSMDKKRTLDEFVIAEFGEIWKEALPYLKQLGVDTKEKAQVAIMLLKNFFVADAIPFLKTMTEKGWQFGKDMVNWAKDEIRLIIADPDVQLTIQKLGAGGKFLIKAPFVMLEYTVNKTEEVYKDLAPVVARTARWAKENYERMIGNDLLHNEMIDITSGDGIFNALGDLGLKETIMAAYDLCSEDDLKLLCKKIWDNNIPGGYREAFVNGIKDNLGDDCGHGSTWEYEDASGNTVSDTIDLDVSNNDIKVPRKFIAQFFILNIPSLKQIDFVGDKAEWVLEGVGGVMKIIASPASFFMTKVRKGIWKAGDAVQGVDLPNAQSLKGLKVIRNIIKQIYENAEQVSTQTPAWTNEEIYEIAKSLAEAGARTDERTDLTYNYFLNYVRKHAGRFLVNNDATRMADCSYGKIKERLKQYLDSLNDDDIEDNEDLNLPDDGAGGGGGFRIPRWLRNLF